MSATQYSLPDGRAFEVRTFQKINDSRVASIRQTTEAAIWVPAEICALGAGRDAWMRDITFPCNDCGAWTKAVELYQELPGSCQACSEKYFHCDHCQASHHPDDACPKILTATEVA